MAYDNICRYLAQAYPFAFVSWLLNVEDIEIQPLPTELSLEPIRSDALYLLPNRGQILHLEFQTIPSSSPPLPLRMLDYWVRLYRKYDCPIEQVVIFLKQTKSPIVYVEQLAVGRTIHPYRVVRLWEEDPTPLLENPALLPLAILARTDTPEVLLRQVADKIDSIEEREEQQNISVCTEILARLKFNKNLIRQFLQEDLMRESPLYQEILQEGELKVVFRLLNRKLGNIEPNLQSKIQQLSSEQLEALEEALLDFSVKQDLINWLENYQ
ncbi:Rpn family recombination-promoting nuclease/putative transposase [Nostoc sp. CENA67]|uniref:Rpn family recombination-promoting nuclease/putative transposase n=1 Tax=Amazonocrinis nigriterrae CENA67 TaxID=2794033 RepID=A0A8J7L743_9NOST|nr:Rpn family recombination-promoting nuclease/putative transposase [Amazonocrinis nigriterrae CENA67]